MPETWALPALDEKTRPFFTSGRIMLQFCSDCGVTQHPPEDVCFGCQGTSFDFAEHRPLGTIYSHTEVVYPIHPTLNESVPYFVALISLKDMPNVRIVGNLIDVSPDDVRIGLPVEAVWLEVRDPTSKEIYQLPHWTALADESPTR
jgi:uncharacterized OB-fold protein